MFSSLAYIGLTCFLLSTVTCLSALSVYITKTLPIAERRCLVIHNTILCSVYSDAHGGSCVDIDQFLNTFISATWDTSINMTVSPVSDISNPLRPSSILRISSQVGIRSKCPS